MSEVPPYTFALLYLVSTLGTRPDHDCRSLSSKHLDYQHDRKFITDLIIIIVHDVCYRLTHNDGVQRMHRGSRQVCSVRTPRLRPLWALSVYDPNIMRSMPSLLVLERYM